MAFIVAYIDNRGISRKVKFLHLLEAQDYLRQCILFGYTRIILRVLQPGEEED